MILNTIQDNCRIRGLSFELEYSEAEDLWYASLLDFLQRPSLIREWKKRRDVDSLLEEVNTTLVEEFEEL